ncbi:hypothetical protein RB597_003966 [Gaeumannomyces tritici]
MVSLFDFQRRKRKLQDEEKNMDDDVAEQDLPPSRGVLAIRPVLQEACFAHAVANNDARTLEWCREPGERIKISVGHGDARYLFLVHKCLLRHHSEYFRGVLRLSGSSASGGGGQPEDGEFDFPEANPDVFGRFVRWLYSCRACKKPRTYEVGHRCPASAARDPASWCGVDRPLEVDYVLGEWLLAPRYCAFVLSHLVPHVSVYGGGGGAGGVVDLARVRWILDNTVPDSSLQRFARHWVSWLKLRWLDGSGPVDWAAHPDLDGLDDGWAATDPHKFRLDHWETRCVPTTANALCPHRVLETAPAAADGSPGSPADSVCKASEPPSEGVWERCRVPVVASFGVLVLVYHILFPFAWVGIASYIVVADDDPLLMEASKFYSLVMGCVAVLGIYPICMRMMKSMYFAMACSVFVIVASVLSFASSATCLAAADRELELNICEMEIGVGVLQLFYAIIVATSYKW